MVRTIPKKKHLKNHIGTFLNDKDFKSFNAICDKYHINKAGLIREYIKEFIRNNK